MPIEVVILLLLFVAVLAVAITRAYLKKQGEQAEAWRWANHKTPLIYEQADHSDASALLALKQYENAIEKLKMHGNKYLLFKNDKGEVFAPDVHLWVWKTDTKTRTDFEAWRLENTHRRVRTDEEFLQRKAEQAKKQGKEIEAARFFAMAESAADFQKDENGQL